ncbi:glycosyltransferase WbuB [Prolixibacteraceae bacterium JC049]|nr:glycosyltransferase WbuB [Prolixibacteraceae bacterium JC049]
MNIWIINQAAGKPSLGWGERHYNLALEFIKKGHDVTIFSSLNNHLFFDDVDKKTPRSECVNGVNFCWIRTIQYKKSKSIKRIIGWFDFILKLMWRVLFSHQQKPDKIIISSSPITPVLPAIVFKKLFSVELIFEIRDIWPLSIQQLGNYTNKSPFIIALSLIEKIAYKYSDKIVGVMKYGNQHVEKITGDKSKSYYWVPNGYKEIEPEEVISYVEDMRSEITAINKSKKIIGYIGTIGIANNMDAVIEIAAYSEKCHFVLIGDGPEKENLLKKIDDLSVSNVTVYNKVPKGQLNHIIPLFDFGIISWKSLGIYEYGVSANKYFDYMFFGKPIIRLGNVKGDPVELYDCGFISECDDSKENAQKIDDFINECDYDKLSENAKYGVVESHSFSVLAEKYQKLFYV